MAEQNNKADENRRKLYNALSEHIENLGSYEKFNERMDDEGNRRKVYDVARQYIGNMDSWETFNKRVSPAETYNVVNVKDAGHSVDGVAAEPQQNESAQKPWKPTLQDRIRIQEDLRRVSGSFNKRTKAQSEQIKKTIAPLTKEGRRKLANAERQARMTGQKTQVSPGSGIGVLDRSPKPYDMKYDKNGKPVVEWLLADGNTTTDMNVARAYDEEAKRQWRQDEFVKRMEANGLDVSNPDHVKTQAAIDAVHSGNYISADERLEILNEITGMGLNPRNQEHIKWVLTGNERKIIQYRLQRAQDNLKELYRQRENERRRKAEEMKKKNEDKGFFEELWDRFAHPSDYGEQPYSPSYIGQVKPHPSVTGATQSQEDIEIENATAEVVALQNALREYDQKVAASGKGWFGQIMQGAWDGITDPNTLTAGFLNLSVNHTARKHKNPQLLRSIQHAENLKAQAPDPGGFYNGGRFAGEMIADPIAYVSGGTGKAVSSGVKRAIAGGAAKKLGGNVAERLAMNSLGGRMISGAAGSGANLFAFEGLRDMRQQIIDGGWTDENGKFHEGFSWGHALSQGGHGLMLGSAMGVFGAGVGNAGDWMAGKVARSTASNGVKAAGETAIRGAQHATAFVGEGTIFAMPDIYEFQTMDDERFDELYAEKYGYADKEGEDRIKARNAARNSMSIDAWSESQAMVFGMKVSGGMAHPKKIISDVSERLGALKAQGERDHTTFPERVRKMMERSHFDVALTKEEKAEMKQAGYGRLSEIFTKDKADPNTKNRPLDDSGKIIPEDAGFDYYSEMGRFMNDRTISQAARAKAYFMLTGHTLPMGTVTGYTTIKGEDGSVTVNSVTADGEVITSRRFSSEAKAQGEINNIMRQAELNSVDMGEHYKADEVRRTAILQAFEEIAEQNPDWTVEGLSKAYEQAKKDMLDPVAAKEIGEGTLKMVQAVDEAAGKKLEELEGETPDAIRERINKAREVDIDEALRKERGKRTDAEQAAIDEYVSELYPEDMGKREEEGEAPQAADAKDEEAGGALPGGVGEAERGPEPIGIATMKYQDRQVEVLSGRVVAGEDGMTDKERSDKTIVVRDVVTGKKEMVPPESLVGYEDYPAAEAGVAKSESEGGYGQGFIRVRGADGSELRGYLTGEIDEAGRYEYLLEGEDRPRYATKQELDGMVTDYQPDEEPVDEVPVEINYERGDTFKVAINGGKEVQQAGVVDREGETVTIWTPMPVSEKSEKSRTMPGYTTEIPRNELDAIVARGEDGKPLDYVPAKAADEKPEKTGAETDSEIGGAPENRESREGPVVSAEDGEEEPATAPTPLQRLPHNDKGKPMFEAAESAEAGWDALVEHHKGDAGKAKVTADLMVENKRKALEKAKKLKPKGNDPDEILDSQEKNEALLAQAEREYDMWQKMAGVEQRRQEAMRAEQEAEARRLAAERAEAEKAEREAREEAARQEREALEGIPEWHLDTPENARKRGARRFGGQLYTRQEPLHGVVGDKIDVFLSDNPTDGDVYVVDQYNPDGTFDEHKVMYGFTSATEAEAAYLSNYSADWAKDRKVVVTGVTREEFKKWLDASGRKTKPFAEYKSVKPIEGEGETEAAAWMESASEAIEKSMRLYHREIDRASEDWFTARGRDLDEIREMLKPIADRIKDATESEIDSIYGIMSEAMKRHAGESWSDAEEYIGDILGLENRQQELERQKEMRRVVAESEEVHVEKAIKTKTDISKLADKNGPENMRGVYHDAERKQAVVTDTKVLVLSGRDYDPSKGGKLETKESLVTQKRLPVERILPKDGEATGGASADFGLLEAKAKQVLAESKAQAKSDGANVSNALRNVNIILDFGEGEAVIVKAETLQKFAHGARHIGANAVQVYRTKYSTKIIAAKGEDVAIAMCSEFDSGAHYWRISMTRPKAPEGQKGPATEAAAKTAAAGDEKAKKYETIEERDREINGKIFEETGIAEGQTWKGPDGTEVRIGARGFVKGPNGWDFATTVTHPDGRKETTLTPAKRIAEYFKEKGYKLNETKFSMGQGAKRKRETYEAAKGLLESAGIEVVEVGGAEAQRMLGQVGVDVQLMGSRTDRKMAKIAEYYAGKELDGNQQAVVDVFSGKRDNVAIEVESQEGKRRVIMRQGKEQNIGAKHSLLRHFETRSNYVIAEEIAMIPEIIAKGERNAHGNKIAYDYVTGDGLRLRVTTEISKGREVFTNLMSNRKPQEVESRKPFGDTQTSAQATTSEVSDAKVGEKFQIGKHVKGEVSSGLSQERVKDMDARYMEAVERGDMGQAQAMVDEAAKRAGYSADSGYQGTSAFNGAAPFNGYGWSKEERREHWDAGDFEGDWTLGDQIDGMDNGDLEFRLFDSRGERSLTEFGRESARNLRAAYKNPERKITVYRSVPSEVKEGALRDGDWVTPSRAYAKDNAAVHGWGRKYRIIEQEVDVDELWWDGNDINEWGYDSGSNMAYRNTRNNRKSLEAVTYDDKGNVIPLSKRFNLHKNDTRYLKTPDGTVYGWVAGGKVFLNRDAMNPETPLHEYSHLWDEMVQKENPELWERGKELMKQTPVWEEVMKDPNYADLHGDEDAVASEVHSRLTGRDGAKLMEEMIDKAKKGGPLETAKAVTIVERLKNWLSDMFKSLKKTLTKWSKRDLENLTAEDFTKMTIRDLAEGMNPQTESRRGENARAAMGANPMLDDYHTGIRGREDVKTFDEVLGDAEKSWSEYGELTYPDMDIEMLRNAKESGRISVYSSKPIETGSFVTPSRMNAEDYAGGGHVYSAEVSVDEVAWISEDEGQMGKTAGKDKGDKEMANERGRRYRKTQTGMSLFDWADKEERSKHKAEKPDERAMAAESADAAIDEYAKAYKEYLEEAARLEKGLAEARANEEEASAIREQLEASEGMAVEARERLRESLREYYVRENSPEDAERIARDMVGRVEAEVDVFLRKEQILQDILDKDAPIKESAEETKSEDKRVKTGGGHISYNAMGHLPDAREGEFAYVERQFSRSGEFSFTGDEVIKDRGDVAYMFRALEDYSIEHVFAVFVKDGKSKILHIGMGGPAASFANMGAIRAGYDAFGAEKIYLVHNHPSGNLEASMPDMQLMKTLEEAFKGEVETEGIIIDTTSGRYSVFDSKRVTDKAERAREGGETAAEVMRFDRAERHGEAEEPTVVRAPEDVARYVSERRLGSGKKLSYVVLAHNNEIVGNFHSEYGSLEAEGLAEEMASVATKFGGTSVIVYGNAGLEGASRLGAEVSRLSLKGVKLLDTMEITNGLSRSALNEGMIRESQGAYGAEDYYQVTELELLKSGSETSDALSNPNRLDVAKLLKGVEKSYDSGKKLLEESEKSDAGGEGEVRYRKEEGIKAREREEAQSTTEAKGRRAEELAQKLKTAIEIAEDASELPEQFRGSKGWYDVKTGKVVVVLPNNANVEDVAETVFHEVVGHKGLREMLGDENYDAFCDEVYDHLKDDLKEEVDRETTRRFLESLGKGEPQAARAGDEADGRGEARASESYEKARRVAVDELFGRLAEKGFEEFTRAERGVWAKLKEKVLEAINKFLGTLRLPKWVRLGDNELRYMLWRSHEKLRSSGSAPNEPSGMDYVDMARDAAKREELGLSAESRFRDGETGDIWKDQSVGLQERITNAAIRLSNNQSGDLTLRNDAQKAVVNNLQSLLHSMRNRRGTTQSFVGADRKVEAGVVGAMNAQAMFDRATVKRVSDLARILMQNGYLSGMTSGEMQRLLSVVKNATAMHDISDSVQKIMDIMIGNQLRNAEGALRQLLSIRGSKVDARGVEVQGVLDVDGQRTMEVVKKAMSLSEDDITDRIAEALNRMGDPDQTIADQAALEYAGLNMALDYVQNIANSKAEEKTLRDSLKTAKEDRDAGRMTDDAYKQFVEATEDAIRKNKVERAEAYFNLVGRLSDSLRESIENAKAFREAEKARVSEIHHNANSDMEGRPTNEHHKDNWKDKFVNNGFVQFLFAPLGTFDQILRVFGNKSANGEGYLWNRFMRGWVDCRNKELLGVKEKFARLDEKAAELFGKGKTWGNLIRMEAKMPKATVSFWDGGEMRDHELTQGNLLYIYMVDKMTDGRMKLRRMGITEDDITRIENFLDPRFKALGDWLQDEFLVDTRNEYNETHKRMFGASMAAIENYFPLKILANARVDKEEDVNQQNRPDGITTKTGSIIKRRVNNLALDITGADALSVILDHITQMEHWSAYAEWNRDLNTLRTYKRFRNQVINMTTVYGGGRKLWENFNDLCLMAAGEYRPPVSKLNKSAVNLAKGVTAAKVSFRMYTALKQLLSAPAYAPEVSLRSIMKSIANPYGDFKWCLENMPIFRERWHSRISGDPRLLKSDMDWKMWRSRIMEISSRIGMTPNAFVDAVTVSIGARAMYETRLKQYLKEGYPTDAAEKRAMQDATILFNQTQQSSESPFLSTMQVDKDWLSTLFTVFRNSAMSYTRQEFDAMRNLKRNLTPGQQAKSIEFMTKQILRDWDVDPDTATDAERDQAQSAAKKRFRRQIKKDVLRLATFGFILELAWNLGPYLPYMFFGNDEDEKDKMWDDAFTHAYFGSVEGLTGGDVMSSFGNMWASGEWNWNQLSKDMPLASDINTIGSKFVGGKNAEAINDILNLLVQMGVGMNPQSLTDTAIAITDACGDDPALSHEAAIFAMRVLQVPQSQIDKMYFDEVDLTGEEASKLTPAQLAQRYAEYKVKRGTPLAPWSWGDEERLGKYEKQATERMTERLEAQGDAKVNEAYGELEARYKAVSEKIKEAEALMEEDYTAGAAAYSAIGEDELRYYDMFRGLDGDLRAITKKWLGAKTAESARAASEALKKYRAKMTEALQSEGRDEALRELGELMDEFDKEYEEKEGGR